MLETKHPLGILVTGFCNQHHPQHFNMSSTYWPCHQYLCSTPCTVHHWSLTYHHPDQKSMNQVGRPVSFLRGISREPWSRWILTIRYVLIQNFWSMRGFNEWEIRKIVVIGQQIIWVNLLKKSLVKVTEFLVMSWLWVIIDDSLWLVIYQSFINSFWSFFRFAFVLQMKKLIWLEQQNRKMIVVSFLVYPIDVSDWSVSFCLGWSLVVEI